MVKASNVDYFFGPLMRGDDLDADYSSCVKWEKQDERDVFFDATMKTSMAFALLSLLACVPAFMTLLAMSCCTATKGMLKALVFSFGFCALFQGLAFVIFASDLVQDGANLSEIGVEVVIDDGEFASGSGISIIGIVFAIVSAVVAALIPAVDEETSAPQVGSHVTPTEDEEAAEAKADAKE